MRKAICLANSRKKSGRCIALRDLDTHEWIRPMPRGCANSTSIPVSDVYSLNVGDVIEYISIENSHRGPLYQSENREIVTDWRSIGRFSKDDMNVFLDDPDHLWISENYYRGKYSCTNKNDNILVDDLKGCGRSLYFLKIRECDYTKHGSKYILSFCWKGIIYKLRVTDCFFSTPYCSGKLSDIYITVSLSEPFVPQGANQQYAYKLVAAIIR